VHRDRARARGVERPTVVAPRSAHPAYAKAAHYFDMDLLQVPLADDYRADAAAAADLVDERTAVVVASAFSYPHGVLDPVADLAGLAQQVGAGCHVDACVGGMVLPFLERLGHDLPPWDFRVEGVTSMSCDLHKYGYVPKGASVVLHRQPDWAQYQWFVFDRWPSGLYGSPAVAGAKSPASVMTAWAFLQHLGLDGYTAMTADLMATTERLKSGFADLGLTVCGDPVATVFAVTSETVDPFAVGEQMERRGWFLNRNTEPRGLHLMVSPAHGPLVDAILADLAESVAAARADGSAASDDVRYA
jgi:sphinganine-1-phosphate aldolase